MTAQQGLITPNTPKSCLRKLRTGGCIYCRAHHGLRRSGARWRRDSFPEVYNDVRRQGGICISDEVQVGFGRLGNWNWGYEKHGVVPDMVILGKPMGNGHPIGAVVTTAEIGAAFDSGPEFFSSFGGNPVSCAAGEAVLRVLEEEGLKAHALDTGTYLKAAFRELSTRHKALADIRGDGLFLGVELLDALGNPNTALAQKLKNGLRESFILIGTDGPEQQRPENQASPTLQPGELRRTCRADGENPGESSGFLKIY